MLNNLQNADPSYEALLAKAQNFLSAMEKDSISVDELSHTLENSYEVIEALKNRLFSIEAKITNIINSRNVVPSQKEESRGTE